MKFSMLEPLAVSDDILKELATPLTSAGDSFIICNTILTEEEKRERAKDSDVIIIANSPLHSNIIAQADKLKLISVGFTGVDHLDKAFCQEKNIMVCNAQGYATEATAELTIGLILSALRHIIPCHARTLNGLDKTGLVGNELKGKTVGIIGTGAIGQRVAEFLKSFGCHLLGYSPTHHDSMKALGMTYTTLEDLLKRSDIVTLHAPLLESTKNMLNKQQIALMKNSAILINCARGLLVDIEALVEALNNDKIAGAALDVFEIEPPLPKDHLITKAKNIIVTPHIAYATEESMLKRAKIVFDNILAWKEGSPQNVKF